VTETRLKTGYAPVNGLELYYEIHGPAVGEQPPLVLLHGGVAASEVFDDLLPALTEGRRVITTHLQAHGRTRDIDRPLRSEHLADDVAALIEHLGLGTVDLAGYSMGGDTALQAAIRHPELVRKLVVISTGMRRDGWYPEGLASFDQMAGNAAQFGEMLKQSPLAERYPDADWTEIFTKIGDMATQPMDWTSEVAAITAPTMLVFADADAVRPEHIVEFYKLLGGGQRDGGLDGSGRPPGRLAILPGTTHYDLLAFPGLDRIITSFLDAPVPARGR
jgi:pimeloyl-ACP methyl ester carboxylesterase